MMKPDRSNYEIWLIDHLDGKLDKIQTEQLMSLLEENPDLKEEFYFYSDIKLTPSSEKFINKNLLKKELSDLTDKQFEYLCAGYVENDLSDEQIEELEKIVSSDIARKNEFELFKKAKLSAPNIRFESKRKLLRATPFQKRLKISVAALTAAASIAMFIVAYQFVGKTDLSDNNLSQIYAVNDKEKNVTTPELPADEVEIATLPIEQIIATNVSVMPVNEVAKEIINVEKDVEVVQDSIFIPPQIDRLEQVKIPDLLSINISKTKDYQNNMLAHSKTVFDTYDFEKPTPSRNLAQIFREKILKEKIPDNSPIKTYELAEAGINGLNKLLGWEMDFRTRIDENGKVKTIYFSSRRFYAQIPVNKSE